MLELVRNQAYYLLNIENATSEEHVILRSSWGRVKREKSNTATFPFPKQQQDQVIQKAADLIQFRRLRGFCPSQNQKNDEPCLFQIETQPTHPWLKAALEEAEKRPSIFRETCKVKTTFSCALCNQSINPGETAILCTEQTDQGKVVNLICLECDK